VTAMASKLSASVERDAAHPGTRIVLHCPYADKARSQKPG
jgi:hypothetical protein